MGKSMSKQDAILWIKNIINDIGSPRHSDLWGYEETLYEIQKLLKEDSAQQWIPCAERLPEEDGTYFVSGVWENGDVEVGQLQYIADEHRFSNVIYFNVDAWMPLPEPYREEATDG